MLDAINIQSEMSDQELSEMAQVLAHELQARLVSRPMLSSWQTVCEYLRAEYAGQKSESFRVLYLDRKNRLIEAREMARGTVDHVPVYPREIMKAAILLDACAIIIAHNHPSGDPFPSESDIAMTRQIKAGCDAIGIALHDHIICGAGDEYSFRANGQM